MNAQTNSISSGNPRKSSPIFMESFIHQFKKPTGFWGMVAGKIMEYRKSNRERNLWTIDLLDIQPSDKVLEVGYGPGLGIETTAQKLITGYIVGIDHSEVMFRAAAKKNRKTIEQGVVRLYCCPIEKLPIFTEGFHKVFMANVMQFWTDKETNIKRLYRSMRKGGRIAITHMPRNKNATDNDALNTGDEIASYLKKGGFTNITINKLITKPALTVCVTAIKR